MCPLARLARFMLLLALCSWLPTTPAVAAAAFAVADTWIEGAQGSQGTNHGTSPTLRLRNSGTRIVLIRFAAPLPDPAGQPVTLNLVVNRVNRAGPVEVRLVQSAWAETTVTFNTRPSIASGPIASRAIALSDAGQVVRFDVTSAVTAWRSNPASNNGLAVLAPTGSLAEVYFDSRETAMGPTLRVSSSSEVTVSKAGGDYSDIAVAVDNAFAGDRWCAANPPQFRCTVNIDAGVFLLTRAVVVPMGIDFAGLEKGQTRIIAAPNLDFMFQMLDSNVRDLTLVNIRRGSPGVQQQDALLYQRTNLTTVSPIRIERVAALTESEGSATGIRFWDGTSPAEIHVIDSEIAARAGSVATALTTALRSGSVEVVRSTLSATGSPQLGFAFSVGTNTNTRVHVEDSVLTGSWTGISARGGGQSNPLELVRSHVTGIEGPAIEILQGGHPLTVLESQLRGTKGLVWFDGVGAIVIDGSTIDVTETALDTHMFNVTTPLDVTILRSQVLAVQRGLVARGESAPVRINVQQSHVMGDTDALNAIGTGSLDISSSVLAGPLEPGAGFTLHCASEVYNQDLQLLAPDCMPRP